MTILPRSFRITDVEVRIASRLEVSARASVRPRVAERLVEWWDAEVARALTGRRDRRITKDEVAGRINDFLVEYRDDTLPDHFSALRPTPDELAAGRVSNIARQIELVRGGGRRVDRAIVARWRARGQRDRWLREDISLAPILALFDGRLQEAWADRHGPMCDDCATAGEEERCRRGLNLLEWAYSEASREVAPPRPDWQSNFYAHGMLQQFADGLQVGWHPDFRARLGQLAPELLLPATPEAEFRSVSDGAGPTNSTADKPELEARKAGQRAVAESSQGTGNAPDAAPPRKAQ